MGPNGRFYLSVCNYPGHPIHPKSSKPNTPRLIGATGVAEFLGHEVVDAIGNSAIDGGGGVVVEVDYASGDEDRKVSTKV
jgi:hypothetical protein